MPKLMVVISSTRPERAGEKLAAWFLEQVKAHGKFEVELVDLRELDLPHLDEPKHPRLGQYVHEHTKSWSARVKAADAFVFVTPEYNFGPPPALLNALDFLSAEWACKAAGFVSYGGVSAGTRSVQMLKMVLTALKIMPLPEAVAVPFFTQYIGQDGVFAPPENQAKAATTMLDELLRWTNALKTLRS